MLYYTTPVLRNLWHFRLLFPYCYLTSEMNIFVGRCLNLSESVVKVSLSSFIHHFSGSFSTEQFLFACILKLSKPEIINVPQRQFFATRH